MSTHRDMPGPQALASTARWLAAIRDTVVAALRRGASDAEVAGMYGLRPLEVARIRREVRR